MVVVLVEVAGTDCNGSTYRRNSSSSGNNRGSKNSMGNGSRGRGSGSVCSGNDGIGSGGCGSHVSTSGMYWKVYGCDLYLDVQYCFIMQVAYQKHDT